jgi:O-antigen/teichoic acid export membrane protein
MTTTTSAAVTESPRVLSRRQEALTLTVANAIDRVLQFGMPVVLTRLLSVADFGQYRLFWLVTLTVSGLAPLGMPRALFYFLPRVRPQARRPYIDNTVLFLTASGAVCAILVVFGGHLAKLPAAGYLTPAFVLLWIVATLLDVLPSADQRIPWQSGSLVALAIARAALVIGAAMTGRVALVFTMLLVFVLLKLGLLAYYLGRFHGWRFPRFARPEFGEQLGYSLPFGIDGALYSLRGNAEQWIVVLLFLPWQYAVYSITAYMVPVVDIVRGSVSNVLLPRMSEAVGRGNVRGMIDLSIEGNLASAAIVLPALAFLFANANDVLLAVFPPAYAGAAPVMRIYVLALARLVLETTGVLMVLRQGRYIMTISAAALVVAATCSYLGARAFGVSGAALGGLVAYYVEAGFSLRRISQLTQLPLRRLQNWPALAVVLGSAAVAAAVSRIDVFAERALPTTIWALSLRGLAMVGVYWTCLELAGYGWIPKGLFGRGRWGPAGPGSRP